MAARTIAILVFIVLLSSVMLANKSLTDTTAKVEKEIPAGPGVAQEDAEAGIPIPNAPEMDKNGSSATTSNCASPIVRARNRFICLISRENATRPFRVVDLQAQPASHLRPKAPLISRYLGDIPNLRRVCSRVQIRTT